VFANVLLHYYDATRLQASLASVKESYSIICITSTSVRKFQCHHASMQNSMTSQVTPKMAAMGTNIEHAFSPSVKYSKAHCIQMTSYLQGISLHVMTMTQQKPFCSISLSTGHCSPPGSGSLQHAFWHAGLDDCTAKTTKDPW